MQRGGEVWVLECEKYIEKWGNFTQFLKTNDFFKDDKLIFMINIFKFYEYYNKID